MATGILVDESGTIKNRIVFDPDVSYKPRHGYTLVEFDGGIGGTYIDGVYTPPPPTTNEDEEE